MLAQAPNSRPSPPLPALPLSDVSLGPVVMADDPCEAAFSGADPTGPRKYYRARYLDPLRGSFLSEDPAGFADGVNRYRYARNQPTRFVDPTGMLCGSGPTDPIVPDSLGIWAHFEEACQAHDACWDNCKKTKGECDAQFYKDMMEYCNQLPRVDRNICQSLALYYFTAVATYGYAAFVKARLKCARNWLCDYAGNRPPPPPPDPDLNMCSGGFCVFTGPGQL